MKKIILSSALFAALLTGVTSVTAQDVASLFIHPKVLAETESPSIRNSKILPLNEVNVHALRDFAKKFENAENITWVDGEAGPSVYFSVDGFKMRSTYAKNGKREYTLKYYDEAAMPKDLRHLVKSNYYDYNIVQVTEVERNSNISYIVKVDDAKQFLTLRVIDGQITVYDKVDKSK